MKIPYVIEIDLSQVAPLEGHTVGVEVDTIIMLHRDPGAQTGMRATVLSAKDPIQVEIQGGTASQGSARPQN